MAIQQLKLIKLMQQNNPAILSESEQQNENNLKQSKALPYKNKKIQYTSMPKSEQEIHKKEIYFNSLLTKHPLKLEKVNSFFENKTQEFTTDILDGKYDIKPLIWSTEQQQHKLINKKKSNEVVLLKRNLENELKNIQNQLQDQQNPKSSRIISEQEHINFMKKIENEKKQLLKKKQQAAKLEQEQRLQEQKSLKQQKQKIEQEKKNKKRKQIQETLRILQEEHKKRIEISKQQELILKQKMKEKTMVDKIEEQYNLKQNQSLQEKKKRLAQIRTLHRPINRQQLDQFADKIENLQKQKIAARNNSVQQTLNKSQQIFYKSAFYKKIQKEKKMFEDSKTEQETNKLKEARDKLKKFSQYVKTTYKPAIDQKLVEEMKFRSVNISKRGHSSSHAVTETPQKIGLRYLEFSKLQVDHQKLLVSGQQEEPQEQKQQKVDYLAQLRKRNKRKEIKSTQDLMQQIEKQNLSKQEKQQKILQFTQKLQKKAKKREQLQKMGKNGVDSSLDALYLQAIEAKLRLLDDF